MATTTPQGFRTEPDLRVTSASRTATGPDFRKADRQFGWMLVNAWTYRPLRLLAGLVMPTVNTAGLQVDDDPGIGQGLLMVRPEQTVGDGAVLLFHGGGYVIGRRQDALPSAVNYARALDIPVFCPGYRLAPEHPFPAALDDCHAAWLWLVEHAPDLGIDPTKIVIGGISAGGGLAAGLVQRIHDEGGPQPAGQLLVYPMLDDRTATRRDLDAPRHRVWSNANNRFGWSGYLGHEPGEPSSPYAVPARREDLTGLPPAWIGVGTCDLFLDEDREYARRLEAAGVDVTYAEVDGAIHGFDIVAGSSLTQAFQTSIAEFLRVHA